MLKLITVILQVIYLFLSHKLDRNKERQAKKKNILKDVNNAFKEKDKKLRASRINSVINDINGL